MGTGKIPRAKVHSLQDILRDNKSSALETLLNHLLTLSDLNRTHCTNVPAYMGAWCSPRPSCKSQGSVLLCSEQDGGCQMKAASARHAPNSSWDTSPEPGLTHFTHGCPQTIWLLSLLQHCHCWGPQRLSRPHRQQAGFDTAVVSLALAPPLMFFRLAFMEIKTSKSNSQLCIFAPSHPTILALPF